MGNDGMGNDGTSGICGVSVGMLLSAVKGLTRDAYSEHFRFRTVRWPRSGPSSPD